MSEATDERSHAATPRRRRQARQAGHVAKSADLTSAVILLLAVLAAVHWGPDTLDYLRRLMQQQLSLPGSGSQLAERADAAGVVQQYRVLTWQLAGVLLPLLMTIFCAAVCIQLAQIGFLLVPRKLLPELGRINPLQGWRRLVSTNSIVRLMLLLGQIVCVLGPAGWFLWQRLPTIIDLAALSAAQAASVAADTVAKVCLISGLSLLALAIGDYAFQWWKYRQQLQMTTQQMREETKAVHNDPQITSRRRSLQRQLLWDRHDQIARAGADPADAVEERLTP